VKASGVPGAGIYRTSVRYWNVCSNDEKVAGSHEQSQASAAASAPKPGDDNKMTIPRRRDKKRWDKWGS
jgi:hypothetical protein